MFLVSDSVPVMAPVVPVTAIKVSIRIDKHRGSLCCSSSKVFKSAGDKITGVLNVRKAQAFCLRFSHLFVLSGSPGFSGLAGG
jgi:hypothetical protein